MGLLSCAQQRMPSGGDKDTTTPQMVYASPEPMSTGFSGQRIELGFDEYVTLQGLRDQVLISPPLDKFPDISLKGGKRLIIDLGEEKLRDNTTYTINFGEAIKDNNEGNPLAENVFLFSTGDYIDTLSLSGQILKARYNEPCADCLAMLFPDVVDSLVLESKPYYVARTDAQGQFKINHLAEGTYRLLALKDGDADLKIDADEAMAFQEGLLSPQPGDSTMYRLRLFNSLSTYTGIKSSDWSADGRVLTLVTRGADSNPQVEPKLRDRLLYVENLGGSSDSLRYWFDRSLEDQNELLIDIDGTTDTLRTGRAKSNQVQQALEMNIELPHAERPLSIRFSRPVQELREDLITIKRDSLLVEYTIIDSITPTLALQIDAQWEPGAAYGLSILPGAFKDIYAQANDSLLSMVRCPDDKTFGILTLDIVLPESDDIYYLELLDKSKKITKHITTTESLKWILDYLYPSDYTLRVYQDIDGNEVWSTGDFKTKVQPEPVFMLDAVISVRANWELEQRIEVLLE